jgi:transglutaminase-like putative cysteine protease
VSGRLLAALPLLCATFLLATGGAPFFWPLGLAVMAAISVVVPWRGSPTTFDALLWMIAGAAGPILWVRGTTTEPPLGLSAAILFSSIAAVRLFFGRALFGRSLDRGLVVVACIAEGIGAKSAAYPYGAVVLAASLLVELGGGFGALRWWVRVPRAAATVVLLSALLATFASVALPMLGRATNRRFQALFEGRIARVNFTPHVRLDRSGFIRTNEDIVLRLHGAEADYLRGAVFDAFDGVYWSTSPRRARAMPGTAATGARTEVDATEATRWLFAPRGAGIVSDTPWAADTLGALRPVDRGVTQWAFAPTMDGVDPPADTDLTVPPNLRPKLEQLALAWTAGAEDDRARAVALVRHLRDDFTYTLDRLPTPPGRSALLDFLLVHREGHCEFFASAFVVLARVLGIPARLVAGYRVVEHNGFGGYAVVRAKHAHAWAEAYVSGATNPASSTFEVFDATPADVPTLAESRTRTLAAFFDYLWTSIVALYGVAIASPERSIPALGGVALVAFIFRALRNRRRQSRPIEDDADAPPVALLRFEARLAKDGFVRDRAETLESLAARLEVADCKPLSLALRRYVKSRYGTGEPSDRDLERALEPGGD